MPTDTVLIIGGSDLGTACALRLFRSGFRIILLESDRPLDIFHSRNYSSAAYSGYRTIEQITTRTIANAIEIGSIEPDASLKQFVSFQLSNREIAFLNLADIKIIPNLDIRYAVIADYELFSLIAEELPEKNRLIGFSSFQESDKIHYLVCDEGLYSGRVIYPFNVDFFPETKITSRKESVTQVKAPVEGVFTTNRNINDIINERDEIGKIGEIPILAHVDGKLTGLLNSGIIIKAKTVFAEISPLKELNDGTTIPASCFCIAGGVLEAILYDIHLNKG